MKNKKKLLAAIDGKEIYTVRDGLFKLLGYFYDAHGSVEEDKRKTWREVELCWCTLDNAVLLEDKAVAVAGAEMECKQYIGDITEDEALNGFLGYADGKAPIAKVLDPRKMDEYKENETYIDIEELP